MPKRRQAAQIAWAQFVVVHVSAISGADSSPAATCSGPQLSNRTGDDTFIHFERHQLAAAPVLESIDALLVDDLSDD